MQAAAVPVSRERLPAGPFVKWAGGKSQLLNQLTPFFPEPATYHRYFEPFLGGGAVFFHLQPERAVLSDLNEDLINVYEVIRDHLESLVRSLKQHQPTEEYYYELRDHPSPDLNTVGRASRFIYLNKWCYNGLYRVNSKGQFNVPRGRYKTPPRTFDDDNLRNVSLLLKGARLQVASYQEALAEAGEGDFVYLDPPYEPLSATAYFTRYTKESFDQVKLAEVVDALDRRGARFLLNNHETDHQRRLYGRFNMETVMASRMINSRPDRRGGVAELIITNYDAR